MTGKASLPRLKDLERMRQIIVRCIEQAMTKARTNDGAHKTIYEKRIGKFRVPAIETIVTLHELDSDVEADDEHQSIPAQAEGTDMKDDGMGRPCNEIEHK